MLFLLNTETLANSEGIFFSFKEIKDISIRMKGNVFISSTLKNVLGYILDITREKGPVMCSKSVLPHSSYALKGGVFPRIHLTHFFSLQKPLPTSKSLVLGLK